MQHWISRDYRKGEVWRLLRLKTSPPLTSKVTLYGSLSFLARRTDSQLSSAFSRGEQSCHPAVRPEATQGMQRDRRGPTEANASHPAWSRHPVPHRYTSVTRPTSHHPSTRVIKSAGKMVPDCASSHRPCANIVLPTSIKMGHKLIGWLTQLHTASQKHQSDLSGIESMSISDPKDSGRHSLIFKNTQHSFGKWMKERYLKL